MAAVGKLELARISALISTLIPTMVAALLTTALAQSEVTPPHIGTALLVEARQLAKWRGWVQGYPDGEGRLERSVTRAELAVAALRVAAGSAASARTPGGCFADVPKSAWYADPVCRARAAGLVAGFADGSFKPEQPATIQDGLTVLARAYGAVAQQPHEAVATEVGLELGYVTEGGPDPSSLTLTRGDLDLMVLGLVRSHAQRAGIPLPSSGCGRAATPPAHLTIDGAARGLIVSLPDPYDPATPYPLVLAFHGRTGTNAEVQRYYGLERTGVAAIYAYPEGMPNGAGSSWSEDASGGLDFFDALLGTLLATTCVDLTRIFAVGHSLGASYVNALACARGEVLRGAAALAGGRPYGQCRGRVAMMIIHNPADRLVPFEEGEATLERFLAQNDLPTTPTPSAPAFLACQRYGDATERYPVLWCPHTISRGPGDVYYPHTWPRGTGEAIMAFFSSLP